MTIAERLALAVALVALLGAGAAHLWGRADQLEEESAQLRHEAFARERFYASRITELRKELRAIEGHVVRPEDLERRVGEVQGSLVQQIAGEIDRNPGLRATRSALRRLDAAEHLIGKLAPSVCLIQGAYGFGRMQEGQWHYLREAETAVLKNLELDGDKVPLMLEGAGSFFTVEFTGTGFLADASGIILTNRHIAEPWWQNDAARPLIQDGFSPRFLYLRAYFPGREESIDCARGMTVTSDAADLAALCFHTEHPLPSALPLAGREHVRVGRPVLLLGYPSGLNALLARSKEDLTEQIAKQESFDPLLILDTLAERGLIRPLPTRGHVSDLAGDKVLFDAPTAVGGSGGPLLDLEGRVVAVNYGILKSFSSANFGVPAHYAVDLLEKARQQH
jgi:S1-C subfamily serine protease